MQPFTDVLANQLGGLHVFLGRLWGSEVLISSS